MGNTIDFRYDEEEIEKRIKASTEHPENPLPDDGSLTMSNID